ncbi:MAG TPA: sulfotransferase family 2 domain-containing protein [Promineifilum sp.]
MIDEAIVFYHIPKSAGTTLNRVIRRNYRLEDRVECGPNTQAFIADFKTWSPERLAKIRFLQGHFPFGLHEILPQRARCFTLLRDPVERVISYYFHALREPAHYLHKYLVGNNWSLKDLLDSHIPVMMNDCEVRLMSGVFDTVPFGEVDEAMLQRAIFNLGKCEVVGLSEQFDRSLLLLQRAFGWRNIRYARVNVGDNRQPSEALPAEVLETVRRYNRLDARLYAEAVKLLEDQVQYAGITFPLRVAAFRMGNRYSLIRGGQP